MQTTTQIDEMVLDIEQDLEIAAPAATVFESLIHKLTDGNTGAEGAPMPMEMERRPGGRWYRNLGEGTGHLWGFVQSIREPDLLEISGPMFMSYPVSNHLIIRLEDIDGGTRLSFRHRALGMIEEAHREGLPAGWQHMLESVKEHASR